MLTLHSVPCATTAQPPPGHHGPNEERTLMHAILQYSNLMLFSADRRKGVWPQYLSALKHRLLTSLPLERPCIQACMQPWTKGSFSQRGFYFHLNGCGLHKYGTMCIKKLRREVLCNPLNPRGLTCHASDPSATIPAPSLNLQPQTTYFQNVSQIIQCLVILRVESINFHHQRHAIELSAPYNSSLPNGLPVCCFPQRSISSITHHLANVI
jgi:hypothetical protein